MRVPSQAEAIHSAIAEAEHDAALTAEGHTRVVPHKDIRPDVAQAADEDVVQQVLALRQETAARVQRAQSSIAQHDVEVAAASAAAAREAAEQAAAAEAAARKERRPWPPKCFCGSESVAKMWVYVEAVMLKRKGRGCHWRQTRVPVLGLADTHTHTHTHTHIATSSTLHHYVIASLHAKVGSLPHWIYAFLRQAQSLSYVVEVVLCDAKGRATSCSKVCALACVQMGPYDATPKRPDPAAPVLPYWAAEEGLVASAADPSLRPDCSVPPCSTGRPEQVGCC
eukprot:scaffold44795_cov39-Tisochrysis_lutea.AAC.5